MHEYSVACALLDQVEALAKEHGAARVEAIHVALGDQAGVAAELLRSAFDLARAQTVAEHAELKLRPVAVRWACPVCGAAPAEGFALKCPEHRRPMRLAEGGELILERVEMEVA